MICTGLGNAVELITWNPRSYGNLRGGVHDPDFGLPGPLRNGIEPNQIHILQAHEPLTDFPFSEGGVADGVGLLLQFGLSNAKYAGYIMADLQSSSPGRTRASSQRGARACCDLLGRALCCSGL